MSASYIGGKAEYTKRYHLGQTLRDRCRHFLLLSATPHSGKQDDFELFMALLDEDRFEGKPRGDAGTQASLASTEDLMRRLVKEELYTFDGRRLFPERHAYTVNYELSPEEEALYDEVTAYVREEMNRAERFAGDVDGDRRRVNVGFALTILQRRLMLEGLRSTGFQITGTWPMRSELGNRMLASGANALASSIVLVCRPRPTEAPPATRQEFVRALRRELPEALSVMMAENVAPVDLAQATIGPGMAIYSRYSEVVEADGSPMRVRTALQIINQALDEYLSEAEGAVDSHTRFALTWFEHKGMEPGPYGEAESIATARNVSVRGVQDAGILEARAGKVRLLPREKLAEGWDPVTDGCLTDWEVVQHLIRALETEGETGAASLLARIGERGEGARDLAYRLYGICDRKRWAEEALAYNGLVVSWPEITRLAAENPSGTETQGSFEL